MKTKKKNKVIPLPKKVGRKEEYQDKYADMAYIACSELGAKVNDLLKLFDCSHEAFNNWQRNHPELKERVRQGKDDYDTVRVERALMKRALGYEYEEKTRTAITLKQKGRPPNGIEIPAVRLCRTIKQMAPDVMAIMFYLQNRQPLRWRNSKALAGIGAGDLIVQQNNQYNLDGLNNEELEELRNLVSKAATSSATHRVGDTKALPQAIHTESMVVG